MRLYVKITFALLVVLALFQIYTSYGSILIARIKPEQSEGTRVEVKTRGENLVFTIPTLQNESVSKSRANQGKPLSPEQKGSAMSPFPEQKNASLPLKSEAGVVPFPTRNDQYRANPTLAPASKLSNAQWKDATRGPHLPPSIPQDSDQNSVLQSFLKSSNYTVFQQVLNQLSDATSLTGDPTASPEKSGSGNKQGGTVAQQSGALLLSSVPGKVKLPIVKSSTVGDNLPPCPDKPPNLVGLRLPTTTPQQLTDLEQRFSFLGPGGDYHPKECRPRQRVAVIIPYRNRWGHLLVLLNNLVPFLIRQQVSFTVFVIEQEPPSTFNRALLLNIGVLEASLRDLYTCFIFHDVDLIPLHDLNLYRCGEQPKHFAVGINKFKYALPYAGYFGGVAGLSREQVEKINGNSNLYFGWGGEDDELLYRVQARGMKVVRYPGKIGRYDMFKHNRDHGNAPNPVRFKLLQSTAMRMDQDGLNSLQYNVTSVGVHPLYTWIRIALDPKQYVLKSPVYVRKLLAKSLRLSAMVPMTEK
ncbi:hypothetical protein ACOMHN_063567 [Nucella lapillus]